MSALAHYFEQEGLATVVIALVREHVEAIRPPRALWVTFELGRPFGAPSDAGLQGRILRAGLELLDRAGPGPILEDFPEEPPYPEGDPDWRPPTGLAEEHVHAEVESIWPLFEQAKTRSGRTTTGISGFSLADAVAYIDRYHSNDPLPNPKGMAGISRARFAIDDIKAHYLEAVAAGEGHPSSHQLLEWFWETTLAGHMIREFQEQARVSDDKNLQLSASGLVPAERANSLR